MIEDWAISFSCGLGDRAHLARISYRLLASFRCCVGGHSRGRRVGGLLILPHDRLWVVPSLGIALNSRSQGSQSSRPNTRGAGVKPVVS
jgi:hypothetical protein